MLGDYAIPEMDGIHGFQNAPNRFGNRFHNLLIVCLNPEIRGSISVFGFENPDENRVHGDNTGGSIFDFHDQVDLDRDVEW